MLQTIFFNLAYGVFGIFYLPHFWLKTSRSGETQHIFFERLGNLPAQTLEKFKNKKVVWLHAVSVGEVMAVRRFLESFLEKTDDLQFVITTVTPTGQKIAKTLEGNRVTACYFPFDFSFSVQSFLRHFKPTCLLLAETEIWPNLLLEAKKARVPVGILNARLSAKSSKRYQRFKSVFQSLFESLAFVLAQTEEDAKRFLDLGVAPEHVHVMGNMKYDNVSLAEPVKEAAEKMKSEWGFHSQDQIFIAGSTHPGEEEVLLEIYNQLKPQFSSLKMIIAPRHIDRSDQITQLARRKGLAAFLSTDQSRPRDFDVLVLNQLGILKNLYAIADVVFVGGSLIRRGGQNPIEPASFKKAILYGPHVFNFKKVYERLHEEAGAMQIQDAEQLAFALSRLLRNKKECSDLGENAFLTVKQLQGATDRHLDWVLGFLGSGSNERKQDVDVHTKLFSKAGGRV